MRYSKYQEKTQEKAAFYIEKPVLTSSENQDWRLNNESEFEIL